MPLILNLDHAKYLLPASANVRELLKSFGAAKRLDFDYQHADCSRYVEREGKYVVEIACVDAKRIRRKKKVKATREKSKTKSAKLPAPGYTGIAGSKPVRDWPLKRTGALPTLSILASETVRALARYHESEKRRNRTRRALSLALGKLWRKRG